MGGGFYCSTSRVTRATASGFYTQSVHETFNAKSVNSAMNPHGVALRESRDSAEHPTSLAIVIALDVTGSMGSVPQHLVRDGLPDIMTGIMAAGIRHPQVLFMGVGDHECDRFPFQVGQFESSDELLDAWLTKTFLEGGGGGNAGESYLLAWYFAAKRTALDCFEKRGKKGFLFTIGDEPVLRTVPSSALRSIFGDGQYQDYSAAELLDEARKTFEVYHVHIAETAAGSIPAVVDGWKQLMGDHLLVAHKHAEVSELITKVVAATGLQLEPNAPAAPSAPAEPSAPVSVPNSL